MPPRVRAAIGAAADDFGISFDELLGAKQSQQLVGARKRAAVNLRAMGFSLPEIGRYLNRHHSTVLHHLGGRSPKMTAEQRLASIPVPDLSGEWAI